MEVFQVNPRFSSYYAYLASHSDHVYQTFAYSSANDAVEAMREAAMAVDAPTEVINAIQVFTAEDGHVYVGIPKEHPAYATACEIEYGNAENSPRPFLRTSRMVWE